MAQTCRTVHINPPKPIITVSAVTANPTTVASGGTVVLTATVKNGGSKSGTVTVTFKKGSIVVGVTSAKVVSPNSTMSFNSAAIKILATDKGVINFCAETKCTEC